MQKQTEYSQFANPSSSMSADLERLESLAHWMDSRFVIPGTNIRFGFDSLLGLIPGAGDTLTLLVTVYLIGKARHFKLPWYVTLQMIWNGFVDWLIGLIPIIGDVFDIGWKANRRNVELLRRHIRDFS